MSLWRRVGGWDIASARDMESFQQAEYPLPQDTCTEIQTEVKKPHRGGAWGQSGDAKSTLAYFFSSCICSLASCVAALCPAILTADMNGAAAAGGVTSPVNTLRNAMSLP